MFFLETWVVVALILLVVVVPLAWRPVAPVSSQLLVPMDRETVERLAFRPIGTIRRAVVSQPFPGYLTLSTRWVPGWAFAVGVLAFPFGLVAVALARESATLHIRISSHRNGTLVQVVGRSRRSVALAVGAVFDEIDALALATESTVRARTGSAS